MREPGSALCRRAMLSCMLAALATLGAGCGGRCPRECDEIKPSQGALLRGPDATTVRQVAFDADPPGARRGGRYEGTVRIQDEEASCSLDSAIFFQARSFRAWALTDVRFAPKSVRELSLSCAVSRDANPTEKLYATIEFPALRLSGEIYLKITDFDWNPAWRPTAVAPPDTIVADSTSMVILDATKSRHPAGSEAMNFQWWVDGGVWVIKGEPVTSTTLPRGRHTVVLMAEDRFGHVSADTMIVWVESSARK